jgi:hypothetical protein
MWHVVDGTMWHRMQIILEPWQVDALRSAAERQGRSMSEVVRAILTEALRPRAASSPNWIREVAGIAYEPATAGQDHDRYLYGAPAEGA